MAEPLGLTIRMVRGWDASLGRFITRIGPVCECGQMMPFFVQIEPWHPEPEYCPECGHEL